MDCDNIVNEFPNHPTGHILPAGLTISEKVGNISGKEFITAVALGSDLNVRLSSSPKGVAHEDLPRISWKCIWGVFFHSCCRYITRT